jgi:hypothetical protein
MPTLLDMSLPVVRYLLGGLTPDESRRIEEALPFNYRLNRELEAAEEELIAAYIVGRLLGQDRLKFETHFLSSDERARKLKFAKAWVETGGSNYPEFTSPFHRYLLGAMTSSEADELEEKLPIDGRYLGELEAAEDELLMAYFHNTLPHHQRELFESNYLTLISDGMLRKLRFAHIMWEYERASVASSSTPENAMGASRQRLEKLSRRRPFHKMMTKRNGQKIHSLESLLDANGLSREARQAVRSAQRVDARRAFVQVAEGSQRRQQSPRRSSHPDEKSIEHRSRFIRRDIQPVSQARRRPARDRDLMASVLRLTLISCADQPATYPASLSCRQSTRPPRPRRLRRTSTRPAGAARDPQDLPSRRPIPFRDPFAQLDQGA